MQSLVASCVVALVQRVYIVLVHTWLACKHPIGNMSLYHTYTCMCVFVVYDVCLFLTKINCLQ